jgi:hypothetical protein
MLKAVTVLNFVQAGVYTGVCAHNMGIPRLPGVSFIDKNAPRAGPIEPESQNTPTNDGGRILDNGNVQNRARYIAIG